MPRVFRCVRLAHIRAGVELTDPPIGELPVGAEIIALETCVLPNGTERVRFAADHWVSRTISARGRIARAIPILHELEEVALELDKEELELLAAAAVAPAEEGQPDAEPRIDIEVASAHDASAAPEEDAEPEEGDPFGFEDVEEHFEPSRVSARHSRQSMAFSRPSAAFHQPPAAAEESDDDSADDEAGENYEMTMDYSAVLNTRRTTTHAGAGSAIGTVPEMDDEEDEEEEEEEEEEEQLQLVRSQHPCSAQRVLCPFYITGRFVVTAGAAAAAG